MQGKEKKPELATADAVSDLFFCVFWSFFKRLSFRGCGNYLAANSTSKRAETTLNQRKELDQTKDEGLSEKLDPD